MAIDTLTFKFEVMRMEPGEVTEGPDDGVYCHGLWLEGESRYIKTRVKWCCFNNLPIQIEGEQG